MLHPVNRLKVGKLFVLGAGASYGACLRNESTNSPKIAPLDRDFCRVIEELSLKKPSWLNEIRDNLSDQWKDHRPFRTFGLEGAIIAQLGHLEFIQSISPRRKKGKYNSTEFLLDITHTISFILNRARTNGTTKLYEKIFNLASAESTQGEGVENRVITFNYDKLLDQYFLAKFKPQQLWIA